jgi:hypothetical protein
MPGKSKTKSRPTYSTDLKTEILKWIADDSAKNGSRGVPQRAKAHFTAAKKPFPSYPMLLQWMKKGSGKAKSKKPGSNGDDFNSLVEQIKEKKAELIDLIEKLKTAV